MKTQRYHSPVCRYPIADWWYPEPGIFNTYIGEFYISHDRTPSTTEIARKFGFSRSSAQRYLVAMNDNGMLSYADGKLKVDQMTKLRTDRTKAPLVGSVPCGELTYEEENVECVMTLPTEIFGSGPFYLLHASGDSMVDEGNIANDDLIDQGYAVWNGEDGMAVDDDTSLQDVEPGDTVPEGEDPGQQEQEMHNGAVIGGGE